MSFKNKIISSILFLCLFENGTFHASENNNSVIEKQNVVMSAKNEKSNVEMMSKKTKSKKKSSTVLSVLTGVIYASMLIAGTIFIGYIGGRVAVARSLATT